MTGKNSLSGAWTSVRAALMTIATLAFTLVAQTAHAYTVSVTGQVLPGNIGDANQYYQTNQQDDGATSISLDSGQITGAYYLELSGHVTGSANLATGTLTATGQGNTTLLVQSSMTDTLTFHLPASMASTVVHFSLQVQGIYSDLNLLDYDSSAGISLGGVTLSGNAASIPDVLNQTLSGELTVTDGSPQGISASLQALVRYPGSLPVFFQTNPSARITLTLEHGVTFTSESGVFLNQSTVTPGIITTYAGNGTQGFSGDGGPATDASLNRPAGVAADTAGNLYIVDSYGHRIRKVDTAGVITTVAGNGTPGFSGDGGPATSASLDYPIGIAVDAAGNLYIADSFNGRVRKVDTATGAISTVAGGGSAANLGDDGPATSASFVYPAGVVFDTAGNFYIADQYHDRVRKVTPAGTITTVAGNGTRGFAGDDGPATDASLYFPTGVTVDMAGNLYIADLYNHRVRKVTPAGIISTVAGTGIAGFSGDSGPAANAQLNSPTGVVVDADGNLYIAEQGNARIRKVTPAGIISSVAGNGAWGFSGDGGPAIDAALYGPFGVTLDSAGNLYIADNINQRVRKVANLATPTPPDTTPPVIQPNVSGTQATNDWYTSDVSVSWSVTDAESAVSSTTGCDAASVTVDTADQMFTCTATSAGGTASQSVTIKRDATMPTASAGRLPIPNSNGWNSGDVTVHFAGTDVTSGIATCAADELVTAEGTNQSAGAGTCTDNAGNISTPVVASNINIDRTAPAVTGVAIPLPGGSGWNTTAVTVSFSGLDALSGVPLGGCTPPIIVPGDGSNLSATGICADLAGNVGSTTITGIKIDSTSPVAVATPTPAPNADGWNNTDVTVSFDGTDALSGSGVVSCTPAAVLTTEGLHSGVQGFCSDVAGHDSNNAVAPNIRIDKTLPTVSVAVPMNGDNYTPNDAVATNYQCSDSLSGVPAANCTATPANGGNVDTGTAGAKTFTATATDLAGNSVTKAVNFQVTDTATQSNLVRVDYQFTIADTFGGFPATKTFNGVAYFDKTTPDTNPGPQNGVYALYSNYVEVAGVSLLPSASVVGSLTSEVTVQDQVPFDPPLDRFGLFSSLNHTFADVTITGVGVNLEGPETIMSGDALFVPNPADFYIRVGAVSWRNNVDGVNYAAQGALTKIKFTPVLGDATAPVITPSVTGTTGSNGWYTSDVAVAWSVSDPESAISSSTGCDAASVTTDTIGQTFTCAATSTGGTATESVIVKRDATKPVATATPAPLPNVNGWNKTSVTATFAGTDATSGIASCTADASVTAEGANQSSSTGTCTDNAGNISNSVFADNINIDKTAPLVSGVAIPVPGASGWNTTAVTVSFSGIDGLSGVPIGGCTAPINVTADGYGLGVTGSCGDRAGNLGTVTISGIQIDKTRPVATATATPAPNANGWNNTDVTVSFDGTDALSGSGIATCNSSEVVTTEGLTSGMTGYCWDVAGLQSNAATVPNIRIDKTPPAVPTILKPIPNDGFVIGEAPSANYSCSDALSGIWACTGSVANGAAISTSSVSGANTFAVSATDRAGNTQYVDRRYTVNPLGTVIVTTVAGNGVAGFSGDGGLATSASLYYPFGVAVDAAGNLYIADESNHLIRKVTPAGIISTVAGNGFGGFSGDGGAATSARLGLPTGVTVDAAGNLYIADESNQRIRKVTPAGVISTVAGNGVAGFGGDGGLATSASLYGPFSVSVDAAGNLYIADYFNQRIRKVTPAGVISTVAGNGIAGFSGDGGLATSAVLQNPYGVSVDAAGNLYIADYDNQRIRKVTPAGVISTVAGNGIAGFGGDGGLATSASLYYPSGVSVDAAGNLYIADRHDQRIRKVTPAGVISTVAGSGVAGFGGDGGLATSASLYYPSGVSVDAAGNLYIGDQSNQRIRRVRDTTYTLAPAAYFGSQALNTASSVPKTITLTNLGPVPIGISSIAITGTNAGQFSQTNNCGITTQTAVQTTCTINVVFRPTSNGAKTAVLTATAGAGLGSKSVALTGTGGATFVLSPYQIAYGNQAIGLATAAQVVSVINTGTLPLGISSITLNGTNGNQFSQTNNCGTSVAAGANCTISVIFQPTTVGAKTANLNVNGATGAGSRTVSLTGTGTPPTYSLTPVSLAFADQAVGASSAARTVTLTNTGVIPVPITSVTDTGTNANLFTETHNCGTSVPVGATCQISVVFRPTTVGAKTATLSVKAGGSASVQTVSVSGTGIVPTYSLSPTALAFQNQAVSVASAALTVTLTNTGVLPLPITSITDSGTNANQFSETHDCGTSVAVGATCTINVVFLPTTPGAKVATLNVNAGGSAGVQTVALSGIGVVPTYALSPTTLAFGSQPRNTSSSAQAVTLTNTGPVAVQVSTVSLAGTNAGQFQQTNDCGSSIIAGGSCTIGVVFRPTSAGAKSASVRVTANGGAVTQNVSLTGTGI